MAKYFLLIILQNDYLVKILFTKAHCLCHDVNRITKSSTHIDVIMGFSTGEIIWMEPISQRYTRLNKNVGRDHPNHTAPAP
jgi:hypothetical protein